MVSRRVERSELLEIDAADIDTNYVEIGSLSDPTRCIKFKSSLNGAVYLTYDPSVDQLWFSEGMSVVEDHTSNSPANGDVFDEPKGRTYYIKWDTAAPGSPSGKFVLECNVPSTGV